MDQNCTQRKATVPEVHERIRQYLKNMNSGCGNYGLFFNGNYGIDHIEFCIQRCVDESDTEGEEIGKVLLTMSKTQRKKLTHSGW